MSVGPTRGPTLGGAYEGEGVPGADGGRARLGKDPPSLGAATTRAASRGDGVVRTYRRAPSLVAVATTVAGAIRGRSRGGQGEDAARPPAPVASYPPAVVRPALAADA